MYLQPVKDPAVNEFYDEVLKYWKPLPSLQASDPDSVAGTSQVDPEVVDPEVVCLDDEDGDETATPDLSDIFEVVKTEIVEIPEDDFECQPLMVDPYMSQVFEDEECLEIPPMLLELETQESQEGSPGAGLGAVGVGETSGHNSADCEAPLVGGGGEEEKQIGDEECKVSLGQGVAGGVTNSLSTIDERIQLLRHLGIVS